MVATFAILARALVSQKKGDEKFSLCLDLSVQPLFEGGMTKYYLPIYLPILIKLLLSPMHRKMS
jgi:hypothetical protein